jgi:uncharacterized cupredoxin-like copper-binding protein
MIEPFRKAVRRRLQGMGITTLLAALALGSCTSTASPETSTSSTSQAAPVVVAPNYEAPPVVINVTVTDEAFEPSTILVPAGRHIRLVLRNRGSVEHHYRIKGLIPIDMRWYLAPELDDMDLDTMTVEELAEYGIVGDIDDAEHVLHHLTPQFVPFREESPAGVKPLPGEVHGYALLGTLDVMTFFASQTGTFESEDVLFPEITGRVIVYEEQT